MNLYAFSRFVRYGAATSVLALAMGGSAFAQDATPQADADEAPGDVIIVTAQRQAQSLQSVPIAVSAFSGEALEKQQIKNASDLQSFQEFLTSKLTPAPNVASVKTSLTIRTAKQLPGVPLGD